MSVTLHTSHGDVKVSLWCEVTPRTCFNFLALCASGYYNGSIFHRNIAGFMIQGGRPRASSSSTSSAGKRGESIWGGTFEDELRAHLKHDARGVLSMANRGPNTNGSQFFFTYAAQPHLDGKFTVFGRIVDGDAFLDAAEAVPVAGKKSKPTVDIVVERVTIHANPLAKRTE